MTRPLTKMNPHRRHAAPGVRSAHVLVAALTLAFAAPVGAVSCTTFFPDGLTADDEIKFESGSQLQGSPDNLLFTAQLDDNSGSTNSCSSTDCGIDSSFGSIADINHTSFPGGNDLEVDENQTGSFSPGNYDKLKLEENSTATLSPGVYTFKEEGEFKEDSTLNISPAGTVEMYFKKKVEADEDTTVTSQSTGSTLFIWSKKEIEIGENSNWEAFLYSRQEEIKLKENSTLQVQLPPRAKKSSLRKTRPSSTTRRALKMLLLVHIAKEEAVTRPPFSRGWIQARWPITREIPPLLSRLASRCPTATTRTSSARQ